MWTIHHRMSHILLLNEEPLLRRPSSIVMLFLKDIGAQNIYRIKIIDTYESTFNLILK